MNSIYPFLAFIVILSISCTSEKTPTINYLEKDVSPDYYEMTYEIGNWEHPPYKDSFESLGNHRVVIEVPGEAPLVQVVIPWRRRDSNPDEKEVVIVDAQSNEIVSKKFVQDNNNEYGSILFAPNPGSRVYHIYYYPHQSTGSYYPKLNYKAPDKDAEQAWFAKTGISDEVALPQAKVIEAQSIDEFNSFFPMEVIASKEEVDIFTGKYSKAFYLFPEYRERPIKMQDYLPVHWVKSAQEINGLTDNISRGEYFTFQVGVFSPDQNLNNIKIDFSDFKGSSTISREQINSFNTEGTDLNGKAFTKRIDVESGKIQPLWFGVQIPEGAEPGSYLGQVIVQPEGLPTDTIFINLHVTENVITNFGDDSPENMSRLRWLNSTIGTAKDVIIKPFESVTISGKKLHILGRDITLNKYGFPEKISSYFTQEMTRLQNDAEQVLAQPITFEVLNSTGQPEEWNESSYEVNQDYSTEANWRSVNSSDSFIMNVTGALEYDGMLEYKIALIAKEDATVADIKLTIPMENEAAQYILGLGFKGGKREDNIAWRWDIKKHQEGAWLGTVNKGLQYVLRDNNYERPLNTNFYQNKPLNLPPSWFNEGKGGINITTGSGYVNVENYSGSREFQKGDTLNFNIRFLITPFKLLDSKTHFSTRFVHKYVPIDSVIKWNGTIVNVHHANEINPYINYPFYNVEQQKAYIDEAHSKGVKVKLYNTIRELSYKTHELFAFKSLGDEILNDGEGGGHSWLQEHFKSNYHSAWHATSVNDAAILNKGNSRWTNYYIEGINWLAMNQEMDGLYLDDIAFSRTTVKRIASVLSEHRDEYVIDLHSANQFNNRDGFTNSAFLYMEHFPYVSRLWFGEYFEYDLSPDYWLTEVAGIPFGLYGEMLEKGGHPYRGLVYGMTTRVYGPYNPKAIWQLFDEFDIANSEMLGYWVDRSPIKTDHPKIKSTIYQHPDKVMISIGSWSDKNEIVALQIDWDLLGIDRETAEMFSPNIQELQDYKTYKINEPVLVPKDMGLILILQK